MYMDDTTSKSQIALFAIVFPAILLVTSFTVNLNGGDWDGVQIALACFFPEAAQDGDIIRYAHEWQPLTYAILRLTYVATGSPKLVMWLPAIFGALGLSLLLLAMSRWSRHRVSLLVLTGIVLLTPELLFTPLYMNSTVFGLPFLALALWLAAPWGEKPSPRRVLVKSGAIGLCLALASLCRFDYLLCYPLFLVLVLRDPQGERWPRVLALGGASVLVLLLGSAMGMVQFTALFERVGQHHTALATSGMHHRDGIEKLQMTLIGANLFLWLAAVVAAFCWLLEVASQRKWDAALMIAVVAVLLYPALSLGTPKYLLPFYACLTVFLAWSVARRLRAGTVGHPAFSCILGAAIMLACFLPCQVTSRPPFIRPTMRTWIGTDDGPRAFWGYAFTLRCFMTTLTPPAWLHPLVTEGQNVLLVAPYDGWLAGPLSQQFLLYMARKCTDVTITPGICAGTFSGKRIVITDPNHTTDILREHFEANNKLVTQRHIPLVLNPTSEAIAQALSTGPATAEELARRVGADPEALRSAIKNLRKAHLLGISDSGQYYLIHQIPSVDPTPRPHPAATL